MNPDGTPETDLERFVLKFGLGRIALQSGLVQEPTMAQVERLEESEFDPKHNPHSWEISQLLRREMKNHE